MYKCINGFTKAKMIEMIMKGNNGTCSQDDEACLYRGPDGNKCVVGCFIPDDKYSPRMEGLGFGDLLVKFPELRKYMPLGEGMSTLQRLHDNFSEGLTVNGSSDPRPGLIGYINVTVED